MTLETKLYRNALITEKIIKLNMRERQKIILELLKDRSERQLSNELGIPHSTIHDWKTLRQCNKGKDIHVSLASMYRKLMDTTPDDIKDWGRIELIKERCEELLRQRK